MGIIFANIIFWNQPRYLCNKSFVSFETKKKGNEIAHNIRENDARTGTFTSG